MKFQALLVSITSLFFAFTIQAQDMRWIDMMDDPNAQFEETVAAFDAWWGDREYTKGSGYKQFQRWKHYMESRVAEDGSQSKPLQTYREFKRYYDQHIAGGKAQLPGESDWTEVGPVDLPANGTGQPNGVGRLTALAFHPTDANTFWVGAPAGGILKTTDYGTTYTNISTNLTRLGVSSIVVNPTNHDTLYIGTGDRDAGDAPGLGVWRTLDGGITWAAHNNGMGNRTVYEILMDPNDEDILIASTNNGIYRSTDAGANWTLEYSGYTNKDIIFHPTDSDVVYAAGSRAFRSLDNGVSWTQLTNGAPNGVSRTAIAVTSAAPDNVYLFSGDSGGFEGFYKSTNQGTLFTVQSTTPNICGYDTNGGSGNQSWYDMAALGDDNDPDHIIIGAINNWETLDGGLTWQILTHWVGNGYPSVHADQHVIEVSPHTGDIFHGHDGGLHYTTNGGTSYTEISDGLAISQIYRFGQSALEDDLSISGFQDNGTAIWDNGNWRTEIGGDGFESIVDYKDSDIMYGALYYGNVRRSTNRGYSFSTIAQNGTNGITESGAWLTPYILDPVNPDTMCIGYKNVWMAYDVKSAATNAVSWVKISNFATTSNIIDLAIAPSNRDRMYVSRSGTLEFFRCDNIHAGTPTWTDLTAQLPASGDPRDIFIHPNNADKVWIALGNNIYESDDAGLTWSDISGTLPNISLNTIVYDPRDLNGAMYVGMDVGIYYKDNSLADWVPFLTDFPNTEVTDLEIYIDAECEGQSKVVASTYGRGLWESPLYFDSGSTPSVCFEASSTQGCVGQILTITDESYYGPTSWTWAISPNTFTMENGTTLNSENIEVSFNAIDLYTITLTATNANGSDMLTKVDYIDINETSITIPISDDLELQSNCNTGSDCGSTVCPLANSWINQTNGSEDDIDFRVDNGGTPSSNTGPSVDSNPGTSAGKYMYTEASGGCTGQTANLVTPCMDLVNEDYAYISFDYHMYGTNVGSLSLDVELDGVWVEDVFTVSGNQGNTWFNTTQSLNDYVGNIVRLRLRAVTGNGWSSDIAIDNIKVDKDICIVDDAIDGAVGSIRFCMDRMNNGHMINFAGNLIGTPLEIDGSGLTVNSDFTIEADPVDQFELSGTNVDRILSVAPGKALTIEGMTIKAGSATLGRAIYNEGDLTLKDVEILENTSPPGSGDLIHNLGTLDIQGNCNIKN